jgi:hypothetical protein
MSRYWAVVDWDEPEILHVGSAGYAEIRYQQLLAAGRSPDSVGCIACTPAVAYSSLECLAWVEWEGKIYHEAEMPAEGCPVWRATHLLKWTQPETGSVVLLHVDSAGRCFTANSWVATTEPDFILWEDGSVTDAWSPVGEIVGTLEEL